LVVPQFLPDPVPHATIEMLVALAQRTPSWSNTQSWEVILTEGAATDRFRKDLVAHIHSGASVGPDFDFPTAYTGEFRQRRRDCGMQLYQSLGITKGDNDGTARQFVRNFEFFDAPHVAIITTEADLGVYGAVDCGLYINTFLLAAHSLGVASTAQAALAAYSTFVHEYFNIPDHRRVLVGISFGYPDLEHPVNAFRTPRGSPNSVVSWHNDAGPQVMASL
jgi:nitroreductase